MLIWDILLVFPLLLLRRGFGQASPFLFYFSAYGFQWQLWSLGQMQHWSAFVVSRCFLCLLHIVTSFLFLSLSPNSFCWKLGMPGNILYQLDIDFHLPSPRLTLAVTFLFCGLIKLLQQDRVLPQCEVFTLICRDHSLKHVHHRCGMAEASSELSVTFSCPDLSVKLKCAFAAITPRC